MKKNVLNRIQTGVKGEDLAVNFLIQHKVKILDRNVRTAHGEIDIIGEKDGCTIFFEVKTRRTRSFGYPETAVNSRKQEHMVNSAYAYLQEQNTLDHPWRIDVIAINLFSSYKPNIEWFQNAITG